MIRFRPPVAGAFVAAACFALSLSGCRGKSAEDYVSAGDAAVAAQKLDEAEGDYKQAISLAPDDPHGYAALGNLYVLESKAGPAQIQFMKVLDLDPKNAPAHMALANSY